MSFILGSSNMRKAEMCSLNFSLESKGTDGKIVSMVMGLRLTGVNGKCRNVNSKGQQLRGLVHTHKHASQERKQGKYVLLSSL